MKIIEDGLYLHDGYAYGPLAERALRRAAQAGERLDRIQEEAGHLTDAQLRSRVHSALRHFTQDTVPVRQVDGLVDRIRQGDRVEWTVPDRLSCGGPLPVTSAPGREPGPPATGRVGPLSARPGCSPADGRPWEGTDAFVDQMPGWFRLDRTQGQAHALYRDSGAGGLRLRLPVLLRRRFTGWCRNGGRPRVGGVSGVANSSRARGHRRTV
ncbi:hypothetical protein ABZX40_41080 [Streptomyces sp. NPDC004610]|uniref:hypothetical protein n=1 Tax=unclassified Streptomyces TaxID=2593676 RepID=UPI0033A59520